MENDVSLNVLWHDFRFIDSTERRTGAGSLENIVRLIFPNVQHQWSLSGSSLVLFITILSDVGCNKDKILFISSFSTKKYAENGESKSCWLNEYTEVGT